MASNAPLPNNLVSYGPDENCTLAICPVDASVLEYRPNLAGNSIFIALFGITFILHALQGIKWRTWTYMSVVLCGCTAEMIGYGGRIILHNDPFSFPGFLIQISPSSRLHTIVDILTLIQSVSRLHRSSIPQQFT